MKTREQKRRRRAMWRDVILIALALIVIPICTAYLVNYIVPTVYF